MLCCLSRSKEHDEDFYLEERYVRKKVILDYDLCSRVLDGVHKSVHDKLSLKFYTRSFFRNFRNCPIRAKHLSKLERIKREKAALIELHSKKYPVTY
mgnify:CR=1 FL=1|tara:strand:+ start:494 stop:784 length:291 start_codon:yes stop_codon:yes gene_type:complete